MVRVGNRPLLRPIDRGRAGQRERAAMSDRYSAEAKEKERATRAALGPRIGHAPIGARRSTLEPPRVYGGNRRRNRTPGDNDSQY